MFAMPAGWNHTVTYPRRSPWRFVVVHPPVENIASALSDFLMFFRRHLFGKTSTVDWLSRMTQVGLMCPPDWLNVFWYSSLGSLLVAVYAVT